MDDVFWFCSWRSVCLGFVSQCLLSSRLVSWTPRPIAFRLRGQDPFDDLGPGWFAMGLGVWLGSSLFLPRFFSL